jgi:hypothetical protein
VTLNGAWVAGEKRAWKEPVFQNGVWMTWDEAEAMSRKKLTPQQEALQAKADALLEEIKALARQMAEVARKNKYGHEAKIAELSAARLLKSEAYNLVILEYNASLSPIPERPQADAG